MPFGISNDLQVKIECLHQSRKKHSQVNYSNKTTADSKPTQVNSTREQVTVFNSQEVSSVCSVCSSRKATSYCHQEHVSKDNITSIFLLFLSPMSHQAKTKKETFCHFLVAILFPFFFVSPPERQTRRRDVFRPNLPCFKHAISIGREVADLEGSYPRC